METPPFAVPGLNHFVCSKVDFFVGVLLGVSLALLLRRPAWVRKKVKGDEDGNAIPPVSTAGPVYCSLCQHLPRPRGALGNVFKLCDLQSKDVAL
eukprot:s2398_g4.t1